jgi:hypothetical protein
MTEDILFDNIYIGHSIDDAKALAAETFKIKKALEEAAAKVDDKDDDEAEIPTFNQDPIGFIRHRVFTFIDLAKLDPVLAVKAHPETAAGLAGAVFTLVGMVGALIALIGGQQKPITKVSDFRAWRDLSINTTVIIII